MRERNLIMRLVVLALMLYALGSFVSAGRELARQQADTRALEARRQELLAERRELEAQITAAEDPEVMRRLAWEKLRMVMPGETVFCFTEPEGETD
ncbi:MAG: septum formation initiator family protein [Oscillospiraceae bacterium]|nr:septum formation initiator family protein [Oscillospiraceae bacterium]